MSVYREVELRCDGVPGDRYGCRRFVIHARTADRARSEAREDGWQTGLPGGRDLCPEHRPSTPREEPTP